MRLLFGVAADRLGLGEGAGNSGFAGLAVKDQVGELAVETGLEFGGDRLGRLFLSLGLEVVVLRNRYGGEDAEKHEDHDDFNQGETTLAVVHFFDSWINNVEKLTCWWNAGLLALVLVAGDDAVGHRHDLAVCGQAV